MLVVCLILGLLSACSTKNNTSGTRAWHSFLARYNTLHNGKMAYRDGLDAQTKGHQDDYSTLLPMYISTKKQTAGMGKSNYDNAIEKCEKAIKLHTIKKKPTVSGGHKLTPKEKEFRNRKEFNPALKDAWLLMAKAQFNQGEFIEAASTFNYIAHMYSTQPEVYSVAKAWLARCYVALEWPYDAEDLLNKMKRDSMTVKGAREKENSMAGFLILAGRYEEAIPHLRETIKHTQGKQQRARLNFLMGQLYNELGNKKMAYKYLGKVARSNPPYEMEFNARIMQTEVMSSGGESRKMIKKLRRMARNERNKDYLDRVYYAIGNIYMSIDDTAKCIGAWEKGVEESTKGGPAKAMLLLRLGQLYWNQENYIESQRCYQQCMSILDKEHEEYKESERRNKILTELQPPLSDIKLQDSLQTLAKLPEAECLAAIDRVIEALKKKEKEEAKKAAANGQTPGANGMGNNMAQNNRTPQNNTPTPAAGGQRGAWYFYNPMTVQSGKQEFQRRWGQRPNEDNWRRSNKKVEKSDEFEEYNYDDEETDSLGLAGGEGAEGGNGLSDEEQALKDSLANDPHHREFYLKQIPFTEEQLASSNAILSEGLYKAGIMEVEHLENFPLALKTLLRLLNDFPDYEKKEDVYYHLFLLTGRMGNMDEAGRYRQLITEEYGEGKIAALLNNPNYVMIATQGRQVEDSLYTDAYRAYMEDRYEVVEKNYQFSTDNFPDGKNRAKLLFVHAMSQLYTGHRTEFMDELKELVQKYPQDEITEMAKSIVKGLEEGRLLSGDKYDATGIWGRRTAGNANDSTSIDSLKADRITDFNFVLAYPTDSLDENQLLFEMARYNFTSFMVRNFEIETINLSGISMMVVHGFLSYDEVHAYAQKLYNDRRMARLLAGIRTVLISNDNLQMLGRQYSFDDYAEFYDRTFAPLVIPDDIRIDDPTDIPFIDPDDYVPEEEVEEEIIDDSSDNLDWLF